MQHWKWMVLLAVTLPLEALAQPPVFWEDVAEGKALYAEMKELYDSLPHDQAMAERLLKSGNWQENRTGHNAIPMAYTAMVLADSIGDNALQVAARKLLATTCFRTGWYEESIEILEEMDSLREEKPESCGHKTTEYIRMATVYTYGGEYDLAMRMFNRARRTFYECGLETSQPYHMQLGYMHFLMGDYAEALQNYEIVLAQEYVGKQDTIRPKGRVLTEGEQAVVWLAQGKVAEAIPKFREALQEFKGFHNWRGVAYHYHNLGVAYAQLKEVDSAFQNFRLAAGINKVLENRNMLAQTYLGMGRLFFAQQQYDSAEHWLLQSLDMAQVPLVREVAKDAHQALGRVYEAQGRTQEALVAYHRYDSVRTQLLDGSLLRMRRLAEDYSEDLHETEVEALTQEATLYSRLSWTLGTTGMLALGLLGLLLNRYRLRSALAIRKQRTLTLERENARLEQDKLQNELDHQQRALAATALHAMQKNEVLTTVQASLEEIAKVHPKTKPSVSKLCRQITQGLQQDKDWESFKIHFEQVHPQFFHTLQQAHPQLSPNDLKHCAYLRINMSVKEVAQMIGINANSVTMVRYRLKKKLDLCPNDNLNEYIQGV